MSISSTGASEAVWLCNPRRGTAIPIAINRIAINSSRMNCVDMDELLPGVAATLLTPCKFGAASIMPELYGRCRDIEAIRTAKGYQNQVSVRDRQPSCRAALPDRRENRRPGHCDPVPTAPLEHATKPSRAASGARAHDRRDRGQPQVGRSTRPALDEPPGRPAN